MTDMTHAAAPGNDPAPAGLAIASLILGIISIVFSLFLVGGILAILGIILGGLHLRAHRSFRVMAAWGLGLSAAGLLASAGMGCLYYRGYRQVREAMRENRGRGAELADWEGVRAPDFSVKTLDGREIRLADLRGRRVVLDFWATWCPPCAREIPHFIELANQAGANDLVVLGISDEPEPRLAKFAQDRGINYPIASATGLPAPYKDVQSIPTTFFVDRNGVIQTVLQGYHDFAALKAAALADDYRGTVKEAAPADAPAPKSTPAPGAE